jgi:Spy/CpxP family protein refolding chaperone
MILNESVRKEIKMNRKRAQLLVVLALVVLMGASFATHNAFGSGEGRHGRSGHDPLFRLFHKLNLTDPQKQQAATILKSHEDEAKAIATGMANARAQLLKAILSGGDVVDASQNVASNSLQAAQLGSKMVSELSGILTPDQKTTLQNMQTKIGSRITERLDKRFAHWDEWIAKHQ